MPVIQIANTQELNHASTPFITHLNYIKCVNRLLSDMTFVLQPTASLRLDLNKISKFERLADITEASIWGEMQSCSQDNTYAQIVAPWIPVKCYYHLYYLEAIFLYLLTGQDVGFTRGGHNMVRIKIREAANSRTLTVSGGGGSELFISTKWLNAVRFRTKQGTSIGHRYHETDDCVQSLRKKVAKYIEDDWKLKQHISDYKTKASRTKRDNELYTKDFVLIDYFYWMRIKSNYRDVDYLDLDDSFNEKTAYEYLLNYAWSMRLYSDHLRYHIKQLKGLR
jgi:hypothetical protein